MSECKQWNAKNIHKPILFYIGCFCNLKVNPCHGFLTKRTTLFNFKKRKKHVIFYYLPLQAFQIGVKYLSKLLWKWTCNIIWNISCRAPSWNFYVWHSVTPLKCLHVVILSIIVRLLNEKFVPFGKNRS